MNIKIGQKIKQLRQRDGRKQEDLANALGVSPQAISRWEASGGYPDMELIPAIANYFNISIDELFGYSKDRGDKLKAILSKADKAIGENGDMTECVEMLRAAIEEFPSEPKLYMNLGFALDLLGWKKYGARSYTRNDSDYAYEDTEYNSQNVYWQEALRAYEKALTFDISAEDRDVMTQRLVLYYAKMGYTDRAKTLASKQNSIISCRETLMPKATEAEERDKYQGEAIISLLTELKNVICNSVCSKISLFTQAEGIKLFVDLAQLYESVFSDGRCGVVHYHLSELYLHAVVFESRLNKNTDQAFEYFKKGFEQKKLYDSVRCSGEYQYTSPLVAKVTFPSENFPSISATFWKGWMEVLPEEIKKRIKSDSNYAECFY
ncbi:MAG: helix-turn-helix domain-containing protein [Ruminococcaceae bacterium]|nr:helix-turn-helix domain-containing protein [Oscillospiraceae bacterium]